MKVVKLILIIMLFGCIPPESSSPSVDIYDIEIYEDLEDCEPCPLLLNFASSNYQNRDWRSAVDNYNQLLKCNCGKLDPENTYKYMAYSYQQLGLYDSAGYIFKQGLKYTPEDTDLLKLAGKNAGRLGRFEDQIYYFDKILSIEDNNLEVLEDLSNVYRDQNMYEEQISIINIWLRYDPSNKNANAEKKAAFSALGKDESDVDRERWESDSENIQYGLDYINSLKESDSFEKIIEVCNELLVYEQNNKLVLRNLGDAYLNLYMEEDALKTYKNLARVDPLDYEIAIEVSKIYINKEEFKEALDWSEKAIKISGQSGGSVYQRAEVYFSIAESCSGDPLTFWDKVVYEIAWEDYKNATNKGYLQAKSRRDFIGDNLITKSSDWFMRPDNENQVKPQGDCYSWINKTIKRK